MMPGLWINGRVGRQGSSRPSSGTVQQTGLYNIRESRNPRRCMSYRASSGVPFLIVHSFLYTYDRRAEAFAAIPYSITAPLQDAETLRWYLASQPLVALDGGAT